MKIRLAKKIMSSGNDYWVDKRIDNAMLNKIGLMMPITSETIASPRR